ncbi:hypothetical protein M407DRAFT_220481 [Tulasnella calospora MUT 4182]|uniref:U4/U6 snRNA-associated-splicing factor PRP24 n=1 Tax=Tulasnella calospora MUT 4182 TaxID=1051891 RepID=A0A0C3LBT4_9AGAM|nr:hypothetical protein M407DRAFT_220481 [Tulasnella calospora MUT 4182]
MSMDVDQVDPAMQALEALPEVLTSVQETPLAYKLHYRAIALVEAAGMEDQLQAARINLTNYLAAGDDIWIPLLESKIAQTTGSDAEIDAFIDVEEMFLKAERDYLSLPILKIHSEYLVQQVARAASSSEDLPDGFDELYAVQSVSARMKGLATKAEVHIAKSHEIWDAWMEWEMEWHDDLPQDDKTEHAIDLQQAYLERLKVPHLNHAETYQNYSMFVSKCLSDREYESAMEAATTARQETVAAIAEREAYEMALTNLSAYIPYISWEEAPKKPPKQRYQKGRNQQKAHDIPPNPKLVVGLYERAITEAASQRAEALKGGDATAGAVVAAEAWLVSFWDGLTAFLLETPILERAVRSVPSSGTLWASRIRALVTIATYALESGVLDAAAITSVALASAAYESHQLSKEEPAVLESGIEKSREKGGDESLKLEKFLAHAVRYYTEPAFHEAIEVWESASKYYKTKYNVWTEYTSFLTLVPIHVEYDKARAVYKNASTPSRSIDYPQAVWSAWVAFEEIHGTVDQLEHAIKRVRKMTQDLAKKAAQAASSQAQAVDAQQFLDAVVAPQNTESAVVLSAASEQGSAMVLDEQATGAPSHHKRKADEEEPLEQSVKRARPGNDRENATVFVAGLWEGLDDDELKRLFKDCGAVREVKITKLPNNVVATVEFMDRESVPAALTKDKKRIQGNEVSVFLGWRSTLYVTNFPEKGEDSFIRDLFGAYGMIFDVRWPSKKFKATRRFCYVQYISPDFAQAALELNGRELEPGMPMNVYISNPQRKKERTDANVEQREIYVAGLAKSTTQKELEELFGECGPIKGVRVPLDDKGKAKGFAFVEFEHETSALAALQLNNREVKKRRIAVTMVDPRAPGRKEQPSSGLGKKADLIARSVRIKKARLGIGAAKSSAAKPPPQQAGSSGTQSLGEAAGGSSSGGKTQDAFRAMLGGGRK